MQRYERTRVVQAAHAILDRGDGCVFEVCMGVPGQRWEARLLILSRSAEAIADAVEAEITIEPDRDARLNGCDRRTLAYPTGVGAHLIYVTDTPSLTGPGAAPGRAG